jgi:hypothetical protein
MNPPIVISGTTGELGERRYCQFWGPVRIAGLERDECLASMANSEGLAINRECPQAWLADIWSAFTLILAGGLPEATHTVVWTFGRPTFTLIPNPVAADAAALFELDPT